jgi:hypothetical protein
MYYSTPIFSFRCKCHLCSGWFEIQTDPQVRFPSLFSAWASALTHAPLSQNTRYVVVSGARRKEEDWDPAENGGFAVHGPHPPLLPPPTTPKLTHNPQTPTAKPSQSIHSPRSKRQPTLKHTPRKSKPRASSNSRTSPRTTTKTHTRTLCARASVSAPRRK